MQVLHEFYLYGSLTKYGKMHKLCVSSVREGLKLLAVNFADFGRDFFKGKYKIFCNEKSENNAFTYEALDLQLGDAVKKIFIVPILEGAKSGGLGKVLLGAVIMVGAVVAAPFTGGTSLSAGFSAFTFGTGGAFAFGLGASIALSGVASSLYKVQPTTSFEKPDSRASTFMSAPVNMSEQGCCLPAIYGLVYAGSVLINAGLEVVDVL